jgi:hypothetical protein
MSRRKVLILVVAVACLVFGGLNLGKFGWFGDGLIVENHSGQTIRSLDLVIEGATTSVRDLADGAKETTSARLKSKERFSASGRLADGSELDGRFSYFANPASSGRPVLMVMPGGKMSLTQTNPK